MLKELIGEDALTARLEELRLERQNLDATIDAQIKDYLEKHFPNGTIEGRPLPTGDLARASLRGYYTAYLDLEEARIRRVLGT